MRLESGSIRIAVRRQSRKNEFMIPWTGFAVCVFLLAGLCWMIGNNFDAVSVRWWLLLAVTAPLAILLLLLYSTQLRSWILPAGVALTGGFCLLFAGQVMPGMGSFGNSLMERMTGSNGKIHLDFSAAADQYILWAVVPMLILWTLLICHSVRNRRIFMAMPALIPIFLGVFTGVITADFSLALIAAGCILLAVHCSGMDIRGIPGNLAVMLLVFAVCTLLGLLLGNHLTSDLSKTAERMVHNVIYHQGGESMPEGDLNDLGAWDKGNTPVLEVVMDQPEKVYLRGRIYEVYTGTSWEDREGEDLSQYEDLFYWLHDAQMFGQSQIGTASVFTTFEKPNSISVRNLAACKAYGYYPYAVTGGDLFAADKIGDTELPPNGTLNYYPGSLPQWYKIQQTLASAQDRENVTEYLKMERAYKSYVYDADLQMTKDSWLVLDRQLKLGDSSMTLSEIREVIRTYLDEKMTYDESVRTHNDGKDFLHYTLERSGSGYSVHYATAATMMLRYFGVPARYVEGYFLSAEEAERYRSGETILLTEAHAHAWAEYYLNGVGFVPFEVTPGYMDDEELELGGLAPMEQSFSGNALRFARIEQPEKIEEPEQDRFTFSMNPKYLLLLIPVGILVLLVLIFVKRKKFNRAMKRIEQAENREAIAMRYGYATNLLQTVDIVPPDSSEAASRLNREARFSKHEMTDLQRHEMDAYAALVLESCKQSWSKLDKLRYRWWDCKY